MSYKDEEGWLDTPAAALNGGHYPQQRFSRSSMQNSQKVVPSQQWESCMVCYCCQSPADHCCCSHVDAKGEKGQMMRTALMIVLGEIWEYNFHSLNFKLFLLQLRGSVQFAAALIPSKSSGYLTVLHLYFFSCMRLSLNCSFFSFRMQSVHFFTILQDVLVPILFLYSNIAFAVMHRIKFLKCELVIKQLNSHVSFLTFSAVVDYFV